MEDLTLLAGVRSFICPSIGRSPSATWSVSGMELKHGSKQREAVPHPASRSEVFYMSVYRVKPVSDMKCQRMANFAISFDVPAAENVLH